MMRERIERTGPGGIVVWLAMVAGICLALTVGVAAEVGAQGGGGGTGGFPKLDSKPVCLNAPGTVLCKTVSESTCGTFGLAWAVLTGDVESCMEVTEYWYWN